LLNWNFHCMTHRTNINIELKKQASASSITEESLTHLNPEGPIPSSFIYLHLAIIMHLNLIIFAKTSNKLNPLFFIILFRNVMAVQLF
jgi:hypothetical protein